MYLIRLQAKISRDVRIFYWFILHLRVPNWATIRFLNVFSIPSLGILLELCESPDNLLLH